MVSFLWAGDKQSLSVGDWRLGYASRSKSRQAGGRYEKSSKVGDGSRDRQVLQYLAELTGDEHVGYVHDSIVASLSACSPEDPGSIPGRGI